MSRPATMIRPATSADLPALCKLFKAFFHDIGVDTPPDRIAANLAAMLADASAGMFIAAQDDGALIGLASATASRGVEYGVSVELEDLYVTPAERGQGVARALVETVLDWARAQGAAEIHLGITPDSDADGALRRFYGRFGFEPSDRASMRRSGG